MLVAGASGFAGALAAQIVWRHPRLELVAVTSRSDAGTRLDQPLPALPGAARADRARPRPARGRRRGDRRLPARRLGAGGRRAARARRCSSSTSPPTSGCATCPPTSAGTASTARPELLEGAVYGLDRALPRASCARPSWSPTPAATRPRACSRWRRWPSAGLIADVVDRRQAGRLRRRPRRRRRRCTTSSMDENAFAYKAEGHRHRPEIEQELAALGSPAPVTFVPHLLPLDQGELASCYAQLERADLQGRGAGALRASATPTSRSSRSSTARRACATSATRTSATSTSPSRSAAGCSPSRRSTTSGRAPPARASRT